MHKLFFIFSLFVSITAAAQYNGYKPVADINTFRDQFARAAQQVKSVKSDFVQEKNLAMLSEKITSRGKFWFRKENLVRMEYQQPFQYLMVINNNTVYIKDGQKENRIAVKSNKLFQQINKITVDCVRGTAFSNPDFKVRAFENTTHYLLEMTPQTKSLTAFFATILITVDKKEYAVYKIDMREQGGDNTLITFTNKELNTTISDALFNVK